jgi:hypothetical protein
MRVRRLPFVDEYVEDGASAVMLEQQVVVLSPLATEVCHFIGSRECDLHEVAVHLESTFGPAPDGETETATRTLLDQLAAQELLLIVA